MSSPVMKGPAHSGYVINGSLKGQWLVSESPTFHTAEDPGMGSLVGDGTPPRSEETVATYDHAVTILKHDMVIDGKLFRVSTSVRAWSLRGTPEEEETRGLLSLPCTYELDDVEQPTSTLFDALFACLEAHIKGHGFNVVGDAMNYTFKLDVLKI